jgi:hypothetical protein
MGRAWVDGPGGFVCDGWQVWLWSLISVPFWAPTPVGSACLPPKAVCDAMNQPFRALPEPVVLQDTTMPLQKC